MSWLLYLGLTWGLALTLAWSRLTAPGRQLVIDLFKLVEAPMVAWAWWRQREGEDSHWLSSGPECPACVGFWTALTLGLAGYGPTPTLGALADAFVAYGVVFVGTAVIERVTDGLDF